ncbi:MAG: zinc ribbon domain-containing protein [Acidobacteria bacterium]|nr:zinc ribbon domain-containing protein [Acidobacteriota bacterium]
MPVYDFTCLERNKNFTLTLPLKEYGKDKLKFPSCGSGEVEQKPAAFFAVTSRKS